MQNGSCIVLIWRESVTLLKHLNGLIFKNRMEKSLQERQALNYWFFSGNMSASHLIRLYSHIRILILCFHASFLETKNCGNNCQNNEAIFIIQKSKNTIKIKVLNQNLNIYTLKNFWGNNSSKIVFAGSVWFRAIDATGYPKNASGTVVLLAKTVGVFIMIVFIIALLKNNF